MENFDRHIFLYAKGHYKKTNAIEDMKKILGKRSGLSPEHISDEDINYVLLDLIYSYTKKKDSFIRFIFTLHPHNAWEHGCPIKASYDFEKVLISACLSVLRFQDIKDIPFGLGRPDPTILPLTKKN